MELKDLFRINKNKTSFVFVGGKGGVGKTTVSASTALWLADNGNKTLIISTDPAHSLSDSFETSIGHYPTPIADNLFAVEVDPEIAIEEYNKNLDTMNDSSNQSEIDILKQQFEMTAMAPGTDEAASFNIFLQYMMTNEYDVVVFDTAPTGHTLRFLSFPEVMDSWLGKMISTKEKFSRLLKSFKSLIPFAGGDDDEEQAIAQLEETKRKIEQARTIMADPTRTSFKMVMIPEDMSILESERAMDALSKYKIHVDGVVINQLMPDISDCDFCKSRHDLQMKKVEKIKDKFPRQIIAEIPLQKGEVKGMDSLREIYRILYPESVIALP